MSEFTDILDTDATDLDMENGVASLNEDGIGADSDNSAKHSEVLNVNLDAFQGPLDLLLHLIKENKVDVFDIPISLITEKYLSYISLMKELDLDVSGEFLVMAANLIYIKSKMLLPVQEDEDDEDFGVDPRDELVQKLLEYQSFKQAAKELGELEEERSKMYTRQPGEDKLQAVTVETEQTEFTDNLYELMEAFSRVIQAKSKNVVHEVYEESVSIEEKIFEIRDLITIRGNLCFKDLFVETKSINELIASFIAILELGKQRFVVISQSQTFGDIQINKVSENG